MALFAISLNNQHCRNLIIQDFPFFSNFTLHIMSTFFVQYISGAPASRNVCFYIGFFLQWSAIPNEQYILRWFGLHPISSSSQSQ